LPPERSRAERVELVGRAEIAVLLAVSFTVSLALWVTIIRAIWG
jgi:hypothetical protein